MTEGYWALLQVTETGRPDGHHTPLQPGQALTTSTVPERKGQCQPSPPSPLRGSRLPSPLFPIHMDLNFCFYIFTMKWLRQQNKFSLLDLWPWSNTARLCKFVSRNKRILFWLQNCSQFFKQKRKNKTEKKWKLNKKIQVWTRWHSLISPCPSPLNMGHVCKDLTIPKN